MTGPTEPRVTLQATWLHLTRVELPALAAERNWPVAADHCFQRILLDNACDGRWYEVILGRPAYAHAPVDVLERATALGRAAIAGDLDMTTLNHRSLAWRTTRR